MFEALLASRQFLSVRSFEKGSKTTLDLLVDAPPL
jgi:hypothetical protein